MLMWWQCWPQCNNDLTMMWPQCWWWHDHSASDGMTVTLVRMQQQHWWQPWVTSQMLLRTQPQSRWHCDHDAGDDATMVLVTMQWWHWHWRGGKDHPWQQFCSVLTVFRYTSCVCNSVSNRCTSLWEAPANSSNGCEPLMAIYEAQSTFWGWYVEGITSLLPVYQIYWVGLAVLWGGLSEVLQRVLAYNWYIPALHPVVTHRQWGIGHQEKQYLP